MNEWLRFLKHWFLVLIREDFLGLCLVFATLLSLIPQLFVNMNLLYISSIGLLLIYVVIRLNNISRLALQTYRVMPLPFSVCLGLSHDFFESAIRQQEQKLEISGIAWNEIKESFKIHQIDWTYFDDKRLSVSAIDWNNKVADIIRNFNKLTNRVPTQPIFHFFFANPAPIAFALGAHIGRRRPIAVYQYVGNVKEPYSLVFTSENLSSDEGYHIFSKRVSNYKYIKYNSSRVNEAMGCDEVLLTLDFTGHDLPKPYPINKSIGEVTYAELSESKGNIPLSYKWIELAQEIASLIFSYIDKNRKVHLLPGIPSSLAFLVGTIVGSVPNILIYHYNRDTNSYTEGFRIDSIN